MPLSFQPLTIDCQAPYAEILAECPEKTSDYTFANLWGWAEHYGLEVAFAHGLAFLRQTRPEVVHWAPVGPWTRADWTGCRHLLDVGRFIRVPAALCALWQEAYGKSVTLTPARDHFDYVYPVQDLVDLSGNRFHKKKNLLNQFLRGYDAVYMDMTMDCVEEVLDMQLDWFRWHEERNPSPALVAENQAIRRVLQCFDRIKGLLGGTIRLDGRIIAYTVAEQLGRDSVVIHFEKGDTRFKGVYQAINQMFLAARASGFTYVNREQDLGDPGLRKAKLSYNPSHFLEKCEAVFRGQ